jgi:hypothetical protein
MQPTSVPFDVLPGTLAMARLPAADGRPPWLFVAPGFWSVTRRDDELSVMGPAQAFPADIEVDGPWRALQMRGPMTLDIVGVAAAFTAPLAAAGVPVMPVATVDTDVVLVHAADLDVAIAALREAGFEVFE